MFIINPDQYLRPSYRISPFRTTDIGINYSLPEDNYIEDYFDARFYSRRYHFTLNGRYALNLALGYFKLNKEDIVTIITTSQNDYISNCITVEIEKLCKWSRMLQSNTKVILINHEFGYPSDRLIELSKTGIPIIEDCAHSFFSSDNDNHIGNIGYFTIYSFPKMFPIQIGGLLVSNKNFGIKNSPQIDENIYKYIRNTLSYHIKSKDEIIKRRLYNYNYLLKRFDKLGLSQRFETDKGSIPGVFMFKTGDLDIDLPELKNYCYAHGIQCSVFYGENAFFIPVHQGLTEQDMDYFYEVIKSFIDKAGS